MDNAINKLEVNKWRTDGAVGTVEYMGAKAGVAMNVQSVRWKYTNNDQGKISDRLSNYAGFTFAAGVTPKVFALTNVSVSQLIYDQNKNLDTAMYSMSGGIRWNVSELTSGEILIGYQSLRFSHAQTTHADPVLSLFQRDGDSPSNLFVAGNMNWRPTSYTTVSLQPYRTIQQTTVAGTLFFVATGANLSLAHSLTYRMGVTLNLGVEQDRFQMSSSTGAGFARTDTVKNAAVGLNYRAVKWLGSSIQYVFEDRNSTDGTFAYRANTVMLAFQSAF